MPPNDPKTLNISWQNGTWVPGKSSNPNGSGGDYNELGYSAIYWTGSQLNFIRTLYGSNISGISSSGTWAQGGVSLYLGNSNWKSKILDNNNERCPIDYVTELAKGRTAIVANTSTKQVYLIITTASQTLTQFRTAIQSYLGITDGGADNATYKGLMLDGGGSSQLKCRNSSGTEISQPDRTRLLTQIITLVNKT